MSSEAPQVLRPWYNSSSFGEGTCVDTQFLSDGSVQVRHSQHPQTVITYSKAEWDTFTNGVKRGNHDSM